MTDEKLTRLERFQAPYNREITLDDIVHESGMQMLRVTVREGRRFTIFDLDAPTAAYWGVALTNWSEKSESGRSETHDPAPDA